jgi:DNA-binding transcriptional LysR family regulator
MDFKTLEYFIDIADLKSISLAAEKNYITQQSMSKQLKKLEQFYGSQLFFRTVPLKLTEDGKLVYHAACDIVHIQSELLEELQRSRKRETISIGYVYRETPPFLMDLIYRFSEKNNEACSIEMISNCLNTPNVSPDIILSSACTLEHYTAFPLLSDHISIVVSKSLMEQYHASPNSVGCEQIAADPLEAFKDFPFVLTESPGGDVLPLETVMETLLKEHHITNIIRTSSTEYSLFLFRNGQGILLSLDHLNRLIFKEEDAFIFTVTEAPPAELTLYCKNDRLESRYAKNFLAIAQEYFT